MFPPDQVKTVKEEIFPKKKDAELIVYAGALVNLFQSTPLQERSSHCS